MTPSFHNRQSCPPGACICGRDGLFDNPEADLRFLRLTRPEEAFEIGLDEALDEGCALIEWPERLGDDPAAWLGPDRLTVTLAEQGTGRHATVSGVGAWDAKLKELHV